MKRLIAIVFALLYLGSVSGWALNLHYCGGELNCISLLVKDDCCACPEEKEPGCCNDEGLFIKASDDCHTSVNTPVFSPAFIGVETHTNRFVNHTEGLSTRGHIGFCAFDLPPPQRIILFRTFLI
jgi:hypothetical protein